MTVAISEKLNSVTGPLPLNLYVTVKSDVSNSARKISSLAHPIIKVLALVLLQAITCALDAYCLVSPIIVVEMTRLIFLCALALIVQSHSASKSHCTDSIVSSFIQA